MAVQLHPFCRFLTGYLFRGRRGLLVLVLVFLAVVVGLALHGALIYVLHASSARSMEELEAVIPGDTQGQVMFLLGPLKM